MIELIKSCANISGLNNDYSNIYYIVNNLQRAWQAEAQLGREMRDKGIKAIIPPYIMPYRLAFLEISNNIINNNYGASKLTEYDDEWVKFFIYGLTVDIIKQIPGEEDYVYINKRHNIVSDFGNFIADVINHVKWNEVNKIKFKSGEPEELFLKVYDKYMKKGEAHKGLKFFSALIAYKKLHEFLSNGNKHNFAKTLIIEDFDDMEPVFRQIVEMLENYGVRVERINSLESSGSGKTSKVFYNFMNPLDEAEVIGFEIKKLLASGAPADDIAIVPYNSKSADLMDFVFHRFGIKSGRVNTLGNSPLFKLFKAAVYTAKYPEEFAEDILSVLSSEYSSCRVSAGTMRWIKKRIKKMGHMVHKKPMETIRLALVKTIEGSEKYLAEAGSEKDKEHIAYVEKDIISIKSAMELSGSSISKILESIVNSDAKLNKDTLYMLYESAAFMDETLCGIKSGEDERFILDALFSATAEREYFEQIDPRKEAVQYINELNACQGGEFFVPVMDARSADNIRSKHIFLMGLDASADKRDILNYPGRLAKALKLPGYEEKKAVIYKKMMNVINNAQSTCVSYAYLGLEGKVEGMANIARMISDDKTRALYPELAGFKIVKNDDNSLIRSSDIIEKEAAVPETMYAYSVNPAAAKFGSKDERHEILGKTKVFDLLETDEVTGDKKVSVTDFVKYIQCPRNFVFSLLAKKTGLMQPDLEGQARIDKGIFWHKVFQNAGTAYKSDFNKDEAGILKALNAGFDLAISEFNPDAFDESFKDDFIKTARSLNIPVFAKLELKRRQRFAGLKLHESEMKIETILNKGIKLHGKIDRIDKYESGVIFWDYKTGDKPPEKMQLLIGGSSAYKGLFRTGYQGAYSIQLIAYLVMAEKKRLDFMTGTKLAGIIGINGYDNLENPEKIAEVYADAKAKMEEAMNSFGSFTEKNIMEIEETGGNSSNLAGPVSCDSCDFEPVCNMLVLKGHDNDTENN